MIPNLKTLIPYNVFIGDLVHPDCHLVEIEEEWRTIPGFEGYYEGSSFGRIKSLERLSKKNGRKRYVVKEKILVPVVTSRGYICVSLKKDKMYWTSVHRVIGKLFLKNPCNKPEINHIDGVKTNNLKYNLEWCTSAENNQHAYDMALHVKKYKGEHQCAKMYFNTQTGIFYDSGADAHDAIGNRYSICHFRNMIIGRHTNKTSFIQV